VQEPWKGRFIRMPNSGDAWGRSQAEADRYSVVPVSGRQSLHVCQARERRSGEILIKAFAREP
jgi:hypothetical protein